MALIWPANWQRPFYISASAIPTLLVPRRLSKCLTHLLTHIVNSLPHAVLIIPSIHWFWPGYKLISPYVDKSCSMPSQCTLLFIPLTALYDRTMAPRWSCYLTLTHQGRCLLVPLPPCTLLCGSAPTPTSLKAIFRFYFLTLFEESFEESSGIGYVWELSSNFYSI